MVEFLHQFSPEVMSPDGRRFVVRVYGAPQLDGKSWDGWLVFFPVDGGAPLVGDRETTQSNRVELGYWAGGIEPVYLEGALKRAERSQQVGLFRRAAWGRRAGELVAEEEIAYHMAREHISAPEAQL